MTDDDKKLKECAKAASVIGERSFALKDVAPEHEALTSSVIRRKIAELRIDHVQPARPGQASGRDVRFVDASKLREWMRQLGRALDQMHDPNANTAMILKSVRGSIDSEVRPWSSPAKDRQ